MKLKFFYSSIHNEKIYYIENKYNLFNKININKINFLYKNLI